MSGVLKSDVIPAARASCTRALGETFAYMVPSASMRGYTSRKYGLGRPKLDIEEGRESVISSGSGVAVRTFCGEVPFLR